jgi:hypothetical protein
MRTLSFSTLLVVASLASLTTVACSSSNAASNSGDGNQDSSDAGSVADAAIDPHITDPGPVTCEAPTTASHCTDQNPNSWVFGIARFNPALVPDGVKPVLRLALRHNFVVYRTENVIGGRLHASANVAVDDVASGQVPFKIDMCADDVAMWSEENGPFNIVGILDFNDNNDMSKATSQATSETIADPDPGEPAGMVHGFDVSCHQAGSCLDLRLECIDGTACTTITPFASCTKTTPGCTSDSIFCN